MRYQIEERENHILIQFLNERLIDDDIRVLEEFLEEYPKENIILQLFLVRSIRHSNALKKLHDSWQKRDLSFIILAKYDVLEDLSDEISKASTETGALEILQMQELERQ